MAAAVKNAGYIESSDPHLAKFKARGGKLLLYHGWADPGPAPANTIHYYNDVVKALGGSKQDDWMRLFLLPGVGHCGGGVGPDQADYMAALERWKETGSAPDQIVAAKVAGGRVAMTRPICAYPKVAVLQRNREHERRSQFQLQGAVMLIKKLHVKPGMRVAVVNAPAGFSLGKLPAGVRQEKSLKGDLDLVMLFAVTQKELTSHWSRALGATKQDGALWVSYPKKTSGIQTDLGMGEWDAPKGSGWNPVAMIGVDDTWSSVRFKHAPGLEEARHKRQDENIADADGTVCVDRTNRIVTAPKDLQTAAREERQGPVVLRYAVLYQPQGVRRLDRRSEKAGDASGPPDEDR